MMNIRQDALRRTESFEGFRGEPYNDHKGNPTIGYGTLLPITSSEASLLLQYRMSLMYEELCQMVGQQVMGLIPQEARTVLQDMVYNMGVPRLLEFVRMWDAIRKKDYETAAAEIMDSKYARQVGYRAKRNADLMRMAGR